MGAPIRAFHGWRIVAVLAVTETISWGILYYAYSVLQLPMGTELRLSSAQLSGAFSLAVLCTGLAAVAVGRWLDVRGPRGLMTAGSIVCALLVAAWSRVDSAVGLYVVMGGIGAARASVLYDPAFAVVVRWFRAKRSTALLTVTVVAGFASTIALPTSNALVDRLGWRHALLVLAAVLAVTTVAPHWLVLRSDPADVGQHPDGAPGPEPGTGPTRQAQPVASSWTATAVWAAKEPVFRWYAAAFAAQSAAVVVVAVHLVPFLREHGHDATFAAAATGALGALSVTGRLVLTGVVRSIPVAVVAATMFTVQGLGVVVLLLAGSTTWGAVGFVLLFGAGFGVGTIARPALLADSFGTARYATVAGLLGVVTTIATTLGPVAAGAARTTSGSYTPVLAALLVLCAAAALCLLRAAQLQKRRRTAAALCRYVSQESIPRTTPCTEGTLRTASNVPATYGSGLSPGS